MKRYIISIIAFLSAILCNAQLTEKSSIVYFTKEISPDALLKIYRSLGVEPQGKVAINAAAKNLLDIINKEKNAAAAAESEEI